MLITFLRHLTWTNKSIRKAHKQYQGEGKHKMRQQIQSERKPFHCGNIMKPWS